MYGSSAGWPPKNPRRKKLATNNQKKKLKIGRTRGVRIGDRSTNGITKRIKILYIDSVLKAVGTGILAGIIVWGVLFLPINYLIMEPTLQKLLVESDPSSSQYAMAKNLIELSSNIFWGSLSLHIVFGGVMGFCARLAIAEGSIIHD